MIKYACDFCGKEFQEDEPVYEIKAIQLPASHAKQLHWKCIARYVKNG